MTTATAHIKALDLFAGTGWGVACQWLGIKESGVEIMDEVVATRTANGMETIYRDVWDGLELTEEQHRKAYGSYGLLIASPPCQTFSLAGKGAGRAALNEVLEAIELHAYKDAVMLKAFGEKHDPRTALVLTPLAYVWRDRPRLVALEQVPTVLPVWEACAEVMREWGYEVKVEILNAEQYGVPQTRKRAILVARRGGPVHMPIPTHSRFYSRTPDKLDPGVGKWVSMAEALGWGMTERPYPTVASGTENGGTDPAALGGSGARRTVYAEREKPGAWASVGNADNDGGILRLTESEAATIQTYPMGLPLSHGVQKNSARRLLTEPAATIAFGHDSASVGFVGAEVQGHLGLRAAKYDGRFTAITVDQAATLQSYPSPPFVWCGNRGKQFLQIGNAVPPVLAEAVLAALIGIRPGR